MQHFPSFGLGLVVIAAVLSGPAARPVAAQDACYVAVIHGSGEAFHDEPEGSAAIESYWNAEGSQLASFGQSAAREAGCTLWRVGYDGGQQWWSERAAGKVAASLHDFIDRYAIADGALTLVGHSMGGLVVRYIVNSGMPGAPYYNEYVQGNWRMDYDLVRRKTRAIIAVQAPLAGTQSADALYGDADHGVSNRGGDVIKMLGWRRPTPATGTMTRSYLENAGSPGGEMGDEGRAVPLYTVAGFNTDDQSGLGMDNDDKLSLAWILLCYKRGVANSWGAACRWDVWNFETIAGDGLVEQTTSHGLWLRGRPNGAAGISGARRAWLDVVHNHNHGRYNSLAGEIHDFVRGSVTVDRLGSYLGRHLPR